MRLKLMIVVNVMVILFISGCSSIPNINSNETQEREVEWSKVLGTHLPGDPVPEEIKLKKGIYLSATLHSVRDGDTITIENVDTSYLKDKNTKSKIDEELIYNNGELAIRFISIDTPEITNNKNEYFGKEAKQAVERVLYSNKVILELDPAALFDNYNRLLAHVYTAEGVSVQKYLLSNGLARVAYLYDGYKHTKDYRYAEEEAKSKKLNIHSIEGYVKWDEVAGFDMNVPIKSQWNLIDYPPDPKDVVEKMKEIKFTDFFNFGITGPE